jgi:hypothetical protein
MMQRKIGVSFFFYFVIFTVSSQLDINFSSGYSFGDRAPITGGEARIFGGGLYRLGFNFHLDDDFSIEASYTFQYLDARARSTSLQLDIDERVAFNYFLVGGLGHLELSDKSWLYGGVKLGVLTLASLEGNFRSQTRFAAGVNGGFRVLFNDRIGLNTGIQLLFPITNVGASFWWSPGQGTSVGVTSSTPFVQFGVSAGLFIRFNNY